MVRYHSPLPLGVGPDHNASQEHSSSRTDSLYGNYRVRGGVEMVSSWELLLLKFPETWDCGWGLGSGMGEVAEKAWVAICRGGCQFSSLQIARNSRRSEDRQGPWWKQITWEVSCCRSFVNLLETEAPDPKEPEKYHSKITYRFYTPYIMVNILHYLNHCVFLATIIQSKTKYVWIAMWHIKPCLGHRQPLDLMLPYSQPPNYDIFLENQISYATDKMLDIERYSISAQSKKNQWTRDMKKYVRNLDQYPLYKPRQNKIIFYW